MKSESILIGKDVIGVGVGALILGPDNKFLLAKRGVKAKNEVGLWELPGGEVEFGEEMRKAIQREILEELGIHIEPREIINVFDHILEQERQHWVTITFRCDLVSGTPEIREQNKCEAIGWYGLEEALALPLSTVSRADINNYAKQSRL